jgi:Fe-S-cluster containining protein
MQEDWMITLEDVASAMPVAERLFPQLQDLYGLLPETHCTCDQPGICCKSLPEMTVLEALHWIRIMQPMADLELNTTFRRFAEFFLTNPARLTECPFLKDGTCTIYRHRTFGCRAYGLWSQEIGRIRTQESREARKALRQMWKSHGVELHADVAEAELEYCGKVQIVSGKPVSHEDLMALLQEVYDLGKPLGDLQNRFELEYHSDFSMLLASMGLGMEKAMIWKLAVIKETAHKGTDTHLKQVLQKISANALRPAKP